MSSESSSSATHQHATVVGVQFPQPEMMVDTRVTAAPVHGAAKAVRKVTGVVGDYLVNPLLEIASSVWALTSLLSSNPATPLYKQLLATIYPFMNVVVYQAAVKDLNQILIGDLSNHSKFVKLEQFLTYMVSEAVRVKGELDKTEESHSSLRNNVSLIFGNIQRWILIYFRTLQGVEQERARTFNDSLITLCSTFEKL